MSLNTLKRRLPQAASLTARLCQSPVAWTISSGVKAQVFPRNNLTPSIAFRPFSQTSRVSSSPFRLSSNPNTTPTPPEDTYPDEGEPHEYSSPYKPKRQWPPDMNKLSPKHQFRLERKYRRRAALKFARPKWTKATKLVQWGVIGFIIIYAVLFMEWDERGSPFDEIRRVFFSGVNTTFSAPPRPNPGRRADGDKEQEA